MERREDESYLEYIKRVTLALEDKQINYLEWGDCVLGADNCYSMDNCRKGYYIVSKMLDKIDFSLDYSSDDMIKLIETQRDELYKERVKLRDQRREYNKILSNQARFEHLVDTMVEEIQCMQPLRFEYKTHNNINIKQVEAVAMISDIHLGLQTDSQFNFYDIDTAINRLNQYKNKIIHYCIKHNVTKLNMEILGDCISGIIHGSVRVQQEEDVISQLMIVSEALSDMAIELQQYIPEVVVYNVYGNHSRLISAKKESISKENMERLISFYMRTRLGDKIKVIDGYTEDFLWYKIKNRTIVLTHGTNDKPTTALNNMIRILGFVPDEIHLAHRHHVETIDDCDTEIIANGSIVGTDTYAVDLRKATKPSQILRIYDEDICNYKIVLD